MDTGSLLYYGCLAVWSAYVTYVVLFSFKKSKEPVVEPTPPPAPVTVAALPPMAPTRPVPSVYGAGSVPAATPLAERLATDGFKTFQTGAELTVDDIVKGLTR